MRLLTLLLCLAVFVLVCNAAPSKRRQTKSVARSQNRSLRPSRSAGNGKKLSGTKTKARSNRTSNQKSVKSVGANKSRQSKKRSRFRSSNKVSNAGSGRNRATGVGKNKSRNKTANRNRNKNRRGQGNSNAASSAGIPGNSLLTDEVPAEELNYNDLEDYSFDAEEPLTQVDESREQPSVDKDDEDFDEMCEDEAPAAQANAAADTPNESDSDESTDELLYDDNKNSPSGNELVDDGQIPDKEMSWDDYSDDDSSENNTADDVGSDAHGESGKDASLDDWQKDEQGDSVVDGHDLESAAQNKESAENESPTEKSTEDLLGEDEDDDEYDDIGRNYADEDSSY